jgi:hypothetical protein
MKYDLNDWMYSINQSKKNIMEEDADAERQYPPFIVNKCLSYHRDSVLFAGEMNRNSHLPKKMQYDFFINTLKPRKRFSPWNKSTTPEDVELVKEYYGYSRDKALQALEILTKDHLDEIKKRLNKGGLR